MPNSSQFYAWALANGANVLSPAAFASLVARQQGAQSGDLPSVDYNTVLRQVSSITTMVAQFMADFGPGNVLDNGDIAALEGQFVAALTDMITSVMGTNFLFVGTDNGPADIIHVTTMSPAVTAFADGQFYLVKVAHTNATPTPHFMIGALGPIPILLSDGTPVPIGYLEAGAWVTLANTGGTSVQLMGGYRSTIPQMNGVVAGNSGNWTVPARVLGLEDLWCFGAGGGGQGASGPGSWGFGGAAGGTAWKAFLPVTPGDTLYFEVASGFSNGGLGTGAGSGVGAGRGGNGGPTFIKNGAGTILIQALGGSGADGSGAVGGGASGGDMNRFGDNGSSGFVVLNTASQWVSIGGQGGACKFGGGITRQTDSGIVGHTGKQGSYPGGGGGGAASYSGATNNGGDGGDGLIKFKYRTANI